MTSKKPPDDYKCLKNKLIKIVFAKLSIKLFNFF